MLMKEWSNIFRAGGIVLMILLVLLGANDEVRQFVGNLGALVPGVGVWISAISAFSADDVNMSFFDTFFKVLGTLLKCLASNILDGLMMGMLVLILENYILQVHKRAITAVLEVGNTILVSLISILVLYVLKLNGESFKTVMVAVIDIALLLVGILVMCGGFHTKKTRYYILNVAINALQAAGGIGLICVLFMAVPLLRDGLSFLEFIFLFLSLVAYSFIFHLANAAQDKDPGPA